MKNLIIVAFLLLSACAEKGEYVYTGPDLDCIELSIDMCTPFYKGTTYHAFREGDNAVVFNSLEDCMQDANRVVVISSDPEPDSVQVAWLYGNAKSFVDTINPTNRHPDNIWIHTEIYAPGTTETPPGVPRQ